MEKAFYEFRPILFLALAFYAVFMHPTKNVWLTSSGLLLAVAVTAIIYARYSYRHSVSHSHSRRRR